MCRGVLATFFGPHGQENNPSGALMPEKVMECGWTNVLAWLRWELNTSLMPFALTHKAPGGQPQSKLWASLPVMFQRIPIWRTCMRTLSCLRLGVSRFKGTPAKRDVDQDMVTREKNVSDVVSDAESGWSVLSDNSSTDSECTG